MGAIDLSGFKNDVASVFGMKSHDGNADLWYKSLPYCFVSTNSKKAFYLPINPSNLNITTHFATNITATLYGVVEEHSEQRFFDITIQGTTGIVPKYHEAVDQSSVDPTTKINAGRSFYISASLTSATGGFFAKTIGRFEQMMNKATDAIKSAQGKAKPHEEGFDPKKTGYMAFHNFYKFLLSEKNKLANMKPNKGVPLIFRNYKDANEYSCVVQSFTLERRADNPMLYFYSIKLKAYDIKGIGIEKTAIGDLATRINDLGLANPISAYARARLTIAAARNAVNSGVGAASSMVGR